MKNFNFYLGEAESSPANPLKITRDGIINLAGVLIFYAIFFVAISIFSG